MAKNTLENFQKHLENLLSTAPETSYEDQKKQFADFSKLFNRFMETKGASIQWDKIRRLSDDSIVNYSNLIDPPKSEQAELLEKLVVIKLNGGLGTSMGCVGPKSQIVVKNKQTFLELSIDQIKHLNGTYNVRIPLIFMNSFNTDEETESVLEKFRSANLSLYSFNQSCFPRIAKDNLMPVPSSGNIKENFDGWYPPGHGDFYVSFWESGLLDRLIDEGKEYCFLSNIDNLGATVDLRLLNLILNNCEDCDSPEFVMEITDKTRADIKGGTLIEYEGKISLLEIAQVPNEHVNDFKSVKQFKYFNTNNLWIKLKAIDRLIREDELKLDIIVNNKSLSNGVKVIQLETAVGAAMKYFNNSIGVNVPRSRFLPVKKCSDLILVMSNLYELDHGALVMSPQKAFSNVPLIALDEKYFKKVSDALARFKGIPDIIELDNLIISGDVTFGKNVSLRGTVVIVAPPCNKIDIPAGAVLENNVIVGDLRVGIY